MKNNVNQIYDFLKKNDFHNATVLAQKLLNENKNDFYLVKALAVCHLVAERNYLAFSWFKKAYEMNQNDFEVIVNLSYLSMAREEFEKSIELANKAITMDNTKHMAYLTLAKVYYLIKEFDLALNNILKTISILNRNMFEIINDFEDIFETYMDILSALNKDDEIEKIINKLKEETKIFNFPIFNAQVRRAPKTILDSDIIEAEKQIDFLINRSTSNRANSFTFAYILFNLGKCYEKIDIKKSDNFYIFANKIIASQQRFKPLDNQKKCINLIKNFLKIKDFKVKNQNKGEGIIFITGLPRSGTTLTESILASNEETSAGGELNIVSFNIPDNFIDNPDIEQLERLGDKYIELTKILRKNKKFFIDKLPTNYELIGIITVALPGAKIVNLKRNHWDVAISQFQQFYVKSVPFTATFFSIAINCGNFEELIRVYSKYIDQSKMMNLEYEKLVNEHALMIEKLYGFCQINSPYLDSRRSLHVAHTASKSQVKEKIYNRSIKKENFNEFKDRFFKDLEMQRDFWQSKNLAN